MKKYKMNFGCKMYPDWRYCVKNNGMVIDIGERCTPPVNTYRNNKKKIETLTKENKELKNTIDKLQQKKYAPQPLVDKGKKIEIYV